MRCGPGCRPPDSSAWRTVRPASGSPSARTTRRLSTRSVCAGGQWMVAACALAVLVAVSTRAAAGISTADSLDTSMRIGSSGWMVGTSRVSGSPSGPGTEKSSMLGSMRRDIVEGDAALVGSGSVVERALRDALRRSHSARPTTNKAPSTISAVRRSSMMRLDGSHPDGFVHVHAHQARNPWLVHRHAHQLLRQLHGGLVVRDEDELHARGHFA